MSVELGAQQCEAFQKIVEWWHSPEQVFYLAGVAGSGKSTLANMVAAELAKDDVVFAAFTGKAASVLRNKGCENASTIHSLIYHSQQSSLLKLTKLKGELQDHLTTLQAEQVEDPEQDEAVIELRKQIAIEEKTSKQPQFRLNEESSVKGYALGILDEVSMVTGPMFEDWCSFKRKVLVMGDPAQLPPVGAKGPFVDRRPDYMLTEIHRQAAGNPIIQLSQHYRRQERPPCGRYGDSVVIARGCLRGRDLAKRILESDQVIVGRNKTRRQYNTRIRELKGFTRPHPQKGDRVVCLRNNHNLGIMNGELFDVLDVPDVDEHAGTILMLLRPTCGGPEIPVDAHLEPFTDGNVGFLDKEREVFDFGWAMTCHKMQGSQAPKVIVLDESGVAGQDWWRWMYTAVTRAEESVVVFR